MVSKVIPKPYSVVFQKSDTPAKPRHRIHEILNADAIGYSFHFLQLNEIATCMKVCKYFRGISQDPLLWRHLSIRFGAQNIENQRLITFIKKAVIDIQSFNSCFLKPFSLSLQDAVNQSEKQNIRTAHQSVLVAVKNKDVLKVKQALINFYSACLDADVLDINTISVQTINRFCSGRDSLQSVQILLTNQMKFDAAQLLMSLAQGGNTESVRLLLNIPGLNFAAQDLAPRYYVNMAQDLTRSAEIRTLIQTYIDQHFREEEEQPHFAIVPPAPGQHDAVLIAQNAPAVVEAPRAAVPAPVVTAASQFIPMEIDEVQTLQDD